MNDELKNLLLNKALHIHLIGVGGSGMSGLALLLLAKGYYVSGSDRGMTREIENLRRQGLSFTTPHSAEDALHSDLVVYSSAIRSGNATFDEAMRLGKKLVRRAELLAALMTEKKGVIVCGMHGKTTTSAMAAHLFNEADFKPSHYVGAEIPILGSNARWSHEGEYFIAEGDESDGTLVHYYPEHALVLNIELEHLDFYQSREAIDAVYQQLIDQTRGTVFYCSDDPGARRVCSQHDRAIAVGKNKASIYRYENLRQQKSGSLFDVIAKNKKLGTIELNVPGAHNVSNAMLVIALACELHVPFAKIAAALQKFRGAKRRFELKYEANGILVFDDYGHHPTEIVATLESARSIMPKEENLDSKHSSQGRIILMFQPHRYSRTAAFYNEFGTVLLKADVAFVSDIYAASELPIEGITGKIIVDSAVEQGHTAIFYEPSLEKMRKKVGALLRKGDLLLCLGAGTINETAEQLVLDLMKRDELAFSMKDGLIRLYEPLSLHTTLRVGGPAQFWAEPETEEAFSALVKTCCNEKIPLMVMGRGSNLLVRDGGIPGVVVHLAKGIFAQYSVKGTTITAGVGIRLKQLAAVARQASIGGFEWMDGIPGNLGGSLRMNAGAMGQQTFEQVVSLRYIDQEGSFFSCTPEELEVRYRDVPFLKNNYVLSATLQGHSSTAEEINHALQTSLKHRKETQPIAASAGCIFKNPSLNSTEAAKKHLVPNSLSDPTSESKISAGRLIQELGLKNYSVGQARISEIHGNFIVNDGGATASEVLQLIDEIKTKAYREKGITMETEVQIVGINSDGASVR